MKDSQLDKMNVEELRDLAKRVGAQIVVRGQQTRVELKEKWTREAQAAGLNVGDVVTAGRRNGKATKVRASSGAMFQNPDDPSQTWAGRGRKPKWLSEAGGNVERFRVR